MNKSLSKISEDNVDYSQANSGLPLSEPRDRETFRNGSGVSVQIFPVETYASTEARIEDNADPRFT